MFIDGSFTYANHSTNLVVITFPCARNCLAEDCGAFTFAWISPAALLLCGFKPFVLINPTWIPLDDKINGRLIDSLILIVLKDDVDIIYRVIAAIQPD